jgi:hypothetical protein
MEIKRQDQPENGIPVGVGSTTDRSKWITMRVSREEMNQLVGIQLAAKARGVEIGISTIIRRLYDTGRQILDLDKAKEDPFSLFQDVEEERLERYANHA